MATIDHEERNKLEAEDVRFLKARLEAEITADVRVILQLMTTERRPGTCNSDINSLRYSHVYDVMKRHAEALRVELSNLGWPV
jgi:hypothetical protein